MNIIKGSFKMRVRPLMARSNYILKASEASSIEIGDLLFDLSKAWWNFWVGLYHQSRVITCVGSKSSWALSAPQLSRAPQYFSGDEEPLFQLFKFWFCHNKFSLLSSSSSKWCLKFYSKFNSIFLNRLSWLASFAMQTSAKIRLKPQKLLQTSFTGIQIF